MASIGRLGLEHRVTPPVRVDPSGRAGPTWRGTRTDAWRRSSRGRYVPSDVELSEAQRIVEVGVLLPQYGAITGWAALHWRGGHRFGGHGPTGAPLPVPVAVPGHPIRTQAGFVVCEERWSPREVEIVDGLRVTTPARSACYEMRYAVNLDQAIVVMDMAAFHDLVSLDEAADWAAAHQSYTGIERARQAVRQGDENAWSPMEVLMRRDLLRMGRRGLLTNRPIFDLGGRHLGTPDLFDPWAGVAFEYDGGVHLDEERRARDRQRGRRFHEHGLEVVVTVAADRRGLNEFHARTHAAYARAREREGSHRTWTLTVPDWWCPTFSVDQRRALGEQDRAVWLRHQAG